MQIEQEVMDKMFSEIKAIGALAVENVLAAGTEQLKLLKEHYEEKIEEMRRQNDGLLGAVGRLQTERDQAQKKLEDLEHLTAQRDTDMKMRIAEEHLHRNLEHERERQEMHRDREKLKDEISRLKTMLKRTKKK